MNRRRVLFVAYNFPPVGGAGVQRTTKFIKYLPKFGWDASVLTVANPSVPVFDQSLWNDIPTGTIIRQGRTLEPGYSVKSGSADANASRSISRMLRRAVGNLARRAAKLVLQPDAQVLWIPDAIRQGMRLLREVRHDAILVTAPPFSSFLIGAILSRRTGIPLVLDYRDEWTISNAYWENKGLGPISRGFQEWLQRRVVREARAIVATTRASAAALANICARAGGNAKVATIYNGFDRDDFPANVSGGSRKQDERFRLIYTGTLWNLTNVAPLVQGIRRFCSVYPELAPRLELMIVGRRTSEQQAHLAGLHGLPCKLVEHPYLEHHRIVELVQSSDALCILLSDLPQADRVVPGKVFECMAAQKPILAIAPQGEVWRLLEGHPAVYLRDPKDIPGVADALANAIRRPADPGSLKFDGFDINRYERSVLAGQLADVLDGVAGVADPVRGLPMPQSVPFRLVG